MSLAVAPDTPWGVLSPLTELMPGTTGARLSAAQLTSAADGRASVDKVLRDAAGRPLVAVVRDAHRHDWMSSALGQLISARPDTIVVEMGVPAEPIGAVTIATFGASTASGRAVAELLAGVAPLGIPMANVVP
jgi:beta-N-acetylhexosaminidase